MHIEDMHARRSVRMLLVRFGEGLSGEFPEALDLTVRERNGDTWLLEHRGGLSPLLAWLSTQDVSEVAIGAEDLKSLYDQFHGAAAAADDLEAPA